jgi:hypothetical protein
VVLKALTRPIGADPDTSTWDLLKMHAKVDLDMGFVIGIAAAVLRPVVVQRAPDI